MSYNFLIVDDSSITRAIIRKTLDIAGIPTGRIGEAANGRAALEMLEKDEYDLAFVDINMPVMSGLEMVQKMHENNSIKRIPVVVISSDGSAARVEELKSKGVRAFIRKPFTPELMKEIVDNVLKSNELDVFTSLGRVLASVLKKMSFVFLEEPEEIKVNQDTIFIKVSMEYTGPKSGIIELIAGEELISEIAGNTLGVSPDKLSREQKLDAFSELLSVTCGNFLTDHYGDRLTFDMKPAKLSPVEPDKVSKYISSGFTRVFEVEGNLLLARHLRNGNEL